MSLESSPRLAGILLIVGALIFWAGAFYAPMWPIWAANSPEEQLPIIHARRHAWLITNGLMGLGVVLTSAGFSAWAQQLRRSGAGALLDVLLVVSTSYTSVWMVLTALRLGATTWASAEMARTSIVPQAYLPLRHMDGVLFATYMECAYLTLVGFGSLIVSRNVLAPWLGWTAIVFGGLGVLLFPTGFIIFVPPLMLHWVPFLLGIWLWRAHRTHER